MSLEAGVFFGLTSALCFGTADFLSKGVVGKVGYLKALFFHQGVGFIPFALFVLLSMNIPDVPFSLWVVILATSFFNMMGILLFFMALSRAKISVVGPIFNSWGIIHGFTRDFRAGGSPEHFGDNLGSDNLHRHRPPCALNTKER